MVMITDINRGGRQTALLAAQKLSGKGHSNQIPGNPRILRSGPQGFLAACALGCMRPWLTWHSGDGAHCGLSILTGRHLCRRLRLSLLLVGVEKQILIRHRLSINLHCLHLLQ